MSLPTAKATQSSILSFFHQKQPKYAPPPPRPGAQQQQQPAQPPSAKLSVPPPPPSPPAAASAPAPAPALSPLNAGAQPTDTQTPAREPLPTAASPHPHATIRPVGPADITPLRRINSLLLPVSYPDAFYAHVLDPSRSALFSRVITWSEPPSTTTTTTTTTTNTSTTSASSSEGEEPKVVGGIVCRLEDDGTNTGAHVLYIQSLCLLSPYRSLGLASAALADVLSVARGDPSIRVVAVYAHVWTENRDALGWYQGRGFARDPTPVEGYYFKLRPDSAWVVRRDLAPLSDPSPSPLLPTAASIPVAPPSQPHNGVTPVGPSATARLANLPPRGPPPPRTGSGQSFQNTRPEMEWNDLPADMAPPRKPASGSNSGHSSRSSSTARRKRDRAYPAEAFGS